MMRFFLGMGPVAWPLLFISIANVILVILRGRQVFGAGARRDPAVEAGINTILFWGVMAAVLGYLGMYTGAYRALSVLAEFMDQGVDPRLVVLGGIEIVSNPMVGLLICVLSSIAWFVLRAGYRRLPAEG
jgi:hypothetical protein